MPVETSPEVGGELLHPASLILIWLAFAFSVPWLSPVELIVVVCLFSIPLMMRHSSYYLKLLRRSRWLLFSLIVVYAFVTPGATEIPVFGAYSPGREGLLAGGLQALRLVSLLATLALLLATTSRDRVLAGLYLLLKPFTLVGMDVDRIAARIWLTLQYAEETEKVHSNKWRERLQLALHGAGCEAHSIRLEIGFFSRSDYAVLLCMGIVMGLLLARGGV